MHWNIEPRWLSSSYIFEATSGFPYRVRKKAGYLCAAANPLLNRIATVDQDPTEVWLTVTEVTS